MVLTFHLSSCTLEDPKKESDELYWIFEQGPQPLGHAQAPLLDPKVVVLDYK